MEADDTGLMDTEELLAVREVQLAYDNMKVVDCLDLSPDGSAAWEAALKRCVLYAHTSTHVYMYMYTPTSIIRAAETIYNQDTGLMYCSSVVEHWWIKPVTWV